MVGSGFVISTHNIEINIHLTRYSRLSPTQAICGRQPYIS